MRSIGVQEFLQLGKHHAIYDVRTPTEYAHAHIPGAYNLPIFSDTERAEIGTLYKKYSREKAIRQGFDIFGPKMTSFLDNLLLHGHPIGDTILFHCWRGGMRSNAMAWLANFYGFNALTLDGGYKAYRNFTLERLANTLPLIIIGGYTGTGKTNILHTLSNFGESIIDLEGIAHHRGSAFGSIGCKTQTSQEDFENRLSAAIPDTFNSSIWIEDESRKIGTNVLSLSLYTQIQNSPIIFIDIPKAIRVQFLVDQYKDTDLAILEQSLSRIKKRLGGLVYSKAEDSLREGDIATCFSYALEYYDKTYSFGILRRDQSHIHKISLSTIDHNENAKIIVDYAEKHQLIKKASKD